MNRSVIFPVLIACILPGLVAACSHQRIDPVVSGQHTHSSMLQKGANAVIQASQKDHFRVSLRSAVHPLPLRKIHTWVVHIETTDGKPAENARVFVFGGMPQHRHDFPTRPQVTAYLGNGDYQVEGIKFSMRGDWQMRFNISHENVEDRVVFDIPVR